MILGLSKGRRGAPFIFFYIFLISFIFLFRNNIEKLVKFAC
jgi:hypothetical protein